MSLDRGWSTVVVVASGPSLNSEQCALVMQAQSEGRCNTITINDTWRMLPTADAAYFGDGSWAKAIANTPANCGAIVTPGLTNIEALRRHFLGEIWTQDRKAADEYGLHYIESKPGAGIHPDADKVYQGANSGHVAVCLARLFGAHKVVLLAFDMQVKPGGPHHWHGSHPAPLGNGNPTQFIKHFDTLAARLRTAGVECLNASYKHSALKCFTPCDLAEALT